MSGKVIVLFLLTLGLPLASIYGILSLCDQVIHCSKYMHNSSMPSFPAFCGFPSFRQLRGHSCESSRSVFMFLSVDFRVSSFSYTVYNAMGM